MNDDLISLYDYGRWANARVLTGLRSVSADDYVKELGGGWPSLRATYVHLASATDAWAGRFSGRDVTVLHTEGQLPTLDDAANLLLAADARFAELLPSFTAETLRAPFTWKNLKGEAKTALLWVVLKHVVNHGTYHRGQIASMLKRVGAKPLATDMVLWGIERYAASSLAG